MSTSKLKTDKLLTTAEVAIFLGISENTLKYWRVRSVGTGPAFLRVGRHIRYFYRDVQAFLRSRRSRSGE